MLSYPSPQTKASTSPAPCNLHLQHTSNARISAKNIHALFPPIHTRSVPISKPTLPTAHTHHTRRDACRRIPRSPSCQGSERRNAVSGARIAISTVCRVGERIITTAILSRNNVTAPVDFLQRHGAESPGFEYDQWSVLHADFAGADVYESGKAWAC